MPQKPMLLLVCTLILMTPRSHTFLQSKLFIAVLHVLIIELLFICVMSLLSVHTQQEGLGLVLAQGFLPCLPSPPHLHLPISPHLQLCGSPGGQTGGSNPKETVPLQGTTCLSLATFPSLVLLLLNFLALRLKVRQTSAANLSPAILGCSSSYMLLKNNLQQASSDKGTCDFNKYFHQITSAI